MGKTVLVVGSGGREHALAQKLAQSPLVEKIYCAPGNAGTATTAKCENVLIEATSLTGLRDFAASKEPDLTVVGPEAPLCNNIVGLWHSRFPDLAIFGPTAKMAMASEGSKVWAKERMTRLGVPTAAWTAWADSQSAIGYLEAQPDKPWVVKADGLCAGKGVFVCDDRAGAIDAVTHLMINRKFGSAGDRIIIEDRLYGTEFSLFAVCDGKKFLTLWPAKDYKPAYNSDEGSNTGGMGCYCPATHLTQELIWEIANRAIAPMVAKLGYVGAIYVGGMLMPDDTWAVLEYNCRFGDPETQAILPLLKNDLFELFLAACRGELPDELEWYDGACVCVVMCSGGYPGDCEKGKLIYGLEVAQALPNVMIFHAGTGEKNGQVVTAGGRVLGVTALAPTTEEARVAAYSAVDLITWEGERHRTDIAENVG